MVQLKDSMTQLYPLEPNRPIPVLNIAPGRIRSDDLLQAIYGDNKENIEKQLKEVKINGEERPCLFTTIGGVDQALKDILIQIDKLVENNQQLSTYILLLEDRLYGV